jgi:uncharacterized protein (DUF433 family)
MTMSDFGDEIERPEQWLERDEVSRMVSQMLPDAPLLKWQRELSKTEDEYSAIRVSQTSTDVLLGMRMTFAAHLLKELVEIDQNIAGGAPVLAGTRFKIARLLAELADGMSISKMAREFRLDKQQIAELLRGLAIYLDRSFYR